MGLLVKGVAAAVEERSEQLPGRGARFPWAFRPWSAWSSRSPVRTGQVRGNGLVADLGLELGQGDLGVAPLSVAQELLRLEQSSKHVAVQPGDSQDRLEVMLLPQGAASYQVANASEGGRQGQREEGRGNGVAAGQLDPALPERRAAGLDRPASQEVLEVLGHRVGRTITFRRLLVQTVQADRFQVSGDLGHQPRGRHDLVLHDLADRLEGVSP